MIRVVAFDTQWIDAAAELENRAGDVGWSREQFVREMEISTARWCAALDDETLIGYAGCWCVDTEAQIVNVVVAPEKRNLGIARRLLERVFYQARAAGCGRGTLEVRSTNVAALALYNHFGFREVGRRRGFYNGTDAILMETEL